MSKRIKSGGQFVSDCLIRGSKTPVVVEKLLSSSRKRFSWEQYMDLSILFKFIFLNWVIEISVTVSYQTFERFHPQLHWSMGLLSYQKEETFIQSVHILELEYQTEIWDKTHIWLVTSTVGTWTTLNTFWAVNII